MPSIKPLYYWDTNIWIAWLMDESHPDGTMEGVEEIISAVERNRAGIVVSDFIDTELLTGECSAAALNKLNNLFKRKNVQRVRVGPNVTKFTGEIRQYYKTAGEKNISPNDAVHLATAIIYEVDAFHTMDDGKIGKSRSLLRLNGNVAGHKLVICKPPPPAQPKLF